MIPSQRRFLLFALLSTVAHAQWLNYPTPGTPRTRDGKPNLSAPAPKLTDGTPDLSGVWEHLNARTTAYYLEKIDIPWQPAALALFQHNTENNQKDNHYQFLRSAKFRRWWCDADFHDGVIMPPSLSENRLVQRWYPSPALFAQSLQKTDLRSGPGSLLHSLKVHAMAAILPY